MRNSSTTRARPHAWRPRGGREWPRRPDSDGKDRVQAGHRLLEDHGDLVAAQLVQLVGTKVQDGASAQADFTGQHTSRPARGRICMMAPAVTLLPQGPDSPTSDSVCPAARPKETPDVTSTTRVSSANPTERSRTSSRVPGPVDTDPSITASCSSRP